MNLKPYLVSLLFFSSCDTPKVDERCNPDTDGDLRGTKWCRSYALSNDYKSLQDIHAKAAFCTAPVTLSDDEKEVMARNADRPGVFETRAGGVDEARMWTAVFGGCWSESEPPEAELRQNIMNFMTTRWQTDVSGFKRYYPGCDLVMPVRPYQSIPFGVTGCGADTVKGGTPRLPTGDVNAEAFIHLEAYYPRSAYDSGTFGSAYIPNSINASNSTELARKMLGGIQINHDIPVNGVKQRIHLDSAVRASNWELNALPRTSFWSKSIGHRIDLEGTYMVTALTTIIKGDATHPKKVITKFMTFDSTDITGTFNDRTKFEIRRGEDEFISDHKSFGDDWTLENIRYTQIHYNILYLNKIVSFIHLFVIQNFDGRNPEEVFCSCTGAQCFEDTAYTNSCRTEGERKFVPPQEDSIYLAHVLLRPDYDGTVPTSGPVRTGSAELKRRLPTVIDHMVGYIGEKGKANNSFYAFVNRKKWPTVLGPNPGIDDPLLLQQMVIAHEVGHTIFGPDHTKDKNHIMFANTYHSTTPTYNLPITTDKGALVQSFKLTQGIWSQP